MRDWFLENYEDPANSTPYDGGEGGYQYIWGGPYDASEEISANFPDAEEDEIETAVDEVQVEGTYEWAPADGRIQPDDYDDVDDINYDTRPLTARLDELGGQIDRIEGHVAELLRLSRIGGDGTPGIGHNRPPEALDDDNLLEIQESIADVRAELARPDREEDVDLAKLQRAETRFGRFLGWVREQAANAPKNLATGAVTAIGGAVTKYVIDNFDGIVANLQPAISTIADWATVVRMVI